VSKTKVKFEEIKRNKREGRQKKIVPSKIKDEIFKQ